MAEHPGLRCPGCSLGVGFAGRRSDAHIAPSDQHLSADAPREQASPAKDETDDAPKQRIRTTAAGITDDDPCATAPQRVDEQAPNQYKDPNHEMNVPGARHCKTRRPEGTNRPIPARKAGIGPCPVTHVEHPQGPLPARSDKPRRLTRKGTGLCRSPHSCRVTLGVRLFSRTSKTPAVPGGYPDRLSPDACSSGDRAGSHGDPQRHWRPASTGP
jgi:hypothetical protein